MFFSFLLSPNRTGIAAILSLACFGCLSAQGGDWPQLLGPNRDGHAAPGETLPANLSGKLKPAWSLPCGQGYAGVSIANGQVAVFDLDAGKERMRLVSLENGKLIWERKLESSYRSRMDPDSGPRCVPSIVDGKIVASGAGGQLSCLALENGAVLWTLDLRKSYGADDGYFGAGSTPLVVGDRVIVEVGGKKGGGIVCIDLNSGKTKWAATNEEASYSSPILLQGNDATAKVVLVPTRLVAYGIRVEDGKILFEFPFGQRGPTVNAATPISLKDGSLFLTASYNIGAYLAKPNGPGLDRVELLYKGNTILSSQYSTPVRVGDYLFASDGRADGGPTSIKCIDPIGPKLLWEKSETVVSHLVAVDPNILAVTDDGRVLVFKGTSEKWELLSEGNAGKGLFRAIPAISNGTLVLRNSSPSNSEVMAFR